MRFSIIIPVYNVKKYLKECVESIITQDFTDYEIIMIDDGSTDGCSELCDKYEKVDARIRVLHKKNGGLSSARNCGLDKCVGEYVIFIDSDDWIMPGSLSAIDACIGRDSPDVLITTLTEIYPEEEIHRDEKFLEYIHRNGIDVESAHNWMTKETFNRWPAQKNILSKKFIDENSLRFLKGRLHEDVDWTSRVIYCARSFLGFTDSWYCHRMNRENSITNSINSQRIIDVIEIASTHYSEYINNPSELRKAVFINIMSTVYAKINLIKYCDKDGMEKVCRTVEANKQIFCIAPSLKYKLFSMSLREIGVSRSLKILKRLNW